MLHTTDDFEKIYLTDIFIQYTVVQSKVISRLLASAYICIGFLYETYKNTRIQVGAEWRDFNVTANGTYNHHCALES